ncbi:MAG: hypothetical protein LBH13_00860 [Cellulomonadaceae bacterium]|jgi:hypothetical protein|nr:hypothetical protein [Cellulomonadaceae bacterium]
MTSWNLRRFAARNAVRRQSWEARLSPEIGMRRASGISPPQLDESVDVIVGGYVGRGVVVRISPDDARWFTVRMDDGEFAGEHLELQEAALWRVGVFGETLSTREKDARRLIEISRAEPPFVESLLGADGGSAAPGEQRPHVRRVRGGILAAAAAGIVALTVLVTWGIASHQAPETPYRSQNAAVMTDRYREEIHRLQEALNDQTSLTARAQRERDAYAANASRVTTERDDLREKSRGLTATVKELESAARENAGTGGPCSPVACVPTPGQEAWVVHPLVGLWEATDQNPAWRHLTIDIRTDRTGVMRWDDDALWVLDDWWEFRWTPHGNVATMTGINGTLVARVGVEPLTFEVTGDRLTVNIRGEQVVLQRSPYQWQH